MNNSRIDSWDIEGRLQKRAAAKLAKIKPTGENPSLQHSNELLHELRVHQIELEMQNEELQRMQHVLDESRIRYADLFEYAPVCYLTLNTNGIITEINLTGATLLGIDREKLINRRFDNYIVDEDKDRWHRHFLQVIQQANTQAIELKVHRADSSIFLAYLDSLTRTLDDKKPSLLRITLTDITQTKHVEQKLRVAASIFESQEGMLITDDKDVILEVNHAFSNITGYKAEDVIGKNTRLLQSGRHNDDFYQSMWDSIRLTGTWKGEVWDRRKNGEIFPARLVIIAVKDQKGTVSHYVAIYDDITLSKLAADEIERLAFYDPLTDLPNRRQLLTRLHQAQASSHRHNMYGAILFVDLDNFKKLNDTFGHHNGDLLLKQVAQRLINSVREEDTVARLGGDEFVVMLENLHQDIKTAATEAKDIATKILATLNQPYSLTEHEYFSSASIGVVLFLDRQNSVEELLKQADCAMYEAKAAGRNALRFFDSRVQSTVTARATMEAELQKALHDQQFKCYFQPQVNHPCTIIGAEMLIRWHHPELGIVLPVNFIPLAEDIGLMSAIDLWVLETACLQLKKWQEFPLTQHLQLAVNISTHQFHQIDFVDQVIATIKKTTIDSSKLKFELVENLMSNDIESMRSKMNALKKFGISFSLGNFGTSYFSLSNLIRLSFDQLKVDKSLVQNISTESTTTITKTVIAITRSLGIEVVAEGVETERQREYLQEIGCTLYQGYLFSHPVPIEEFEKLLQGELPCT